MPSSPVPVPADEAALVRSRLSGLGLPGLIDVHTHFMPKNVMDKVWAYFDDAGPMLGREWPIAYRDGEDERVERLADFGVERWSSLNYSHRPGMAEFLNQWSAGFADAHPACLRSATFFPEEGAGRYVTSAIDAGAQIFKAHVQVGQYDPNDPLLDDVWGVLEESGTPLVIHSGDGPVPGRFTGVDGMVELLRRFPRLTLVIAHLGMPEYAAFLGLAERHERVFLDTTMAFTDFVEESAPFPDAERPRLHALGEKILFGSDYPNIPYPYVHAVDAVLAVSPGDDWSRKVLRDNAAALFHL